jgi:hypothetical protein
MSVLRGRYGSGCVRSAGTLIFLGRNSSQSGAWRKSKVTAQFGSGPANERYEISVSLQVLHVSAQASIAGRVKAAMGRRKVVAGR